MKQVYNPYLPLDTYIPDGEPHVFGDRIYVFGSHDKEGGGAFCLLDYEGWSTPVDDLTAWRYEGIIYQSRQDPLYDPNGKYRHIYAPDVVCGPDGKYYLYYAMAGGCFTGPIHVAVCDTPAGKYAYYGEVRNPDGSVFDRCVTFDPAVLNDNGEIYLYYGWALAAPRMLGMSREEKQKMKQQVMPALEQKMFDKSPEQIQREPFGIQGANAAKLRSDMLTVEEGPKRIVPGILDSSDTSFEGHAFFEASSILKIEDTYYFIYSSESYNELCYATSKYPDRDFCFQGVLISNKEIFQDQRLAEKQKGIDTNNHGSLVEIDHQWYIFYHRHTHKSHFSRQACAEKITRLQDGSFQQAELSSCGLNPGALPAEGTFPAAIACHIWNGVAPDFGQDLSEVSFPHVTHEDDQRFLSQITDGTRLGFKYFAFKGNVRLKLILRGTASGVITVLTGDQEQAKVGVAPSTDWKEYTTIFSESGEQSLWFDYHGSGELEFLEFSFT